MVAHKTNVGEIDTSSPIQSVKDAVTLFGEGAFSGEKNGKPQSADRVLAKELNKLKEQLKNAETTKAQALVELEAAKTTVKGLTQKLNGSSNMDLEAVRIEYIIVKTVTSELESAKESLSKVAEEESSLRALVETLKLELDTIKKEHSEFKDKEVETDSVSGNLNMKLRKAKSELEEAIALAGKSRGVCYETIHLDSQKARREAEETKREAQELKREVEASRIKLDEAEKKLEIAINEAEEAKAAEARALDQIQERTTVSSTANHVTVSREEFESLSRKVDESEKIAEMKVAAAMADVEAVKASENEARMRLKAARKEIEEMKTARLEAVKRVEMAEAAKKAVEGELRRWRQREQKQAAEAVSRILAERDKAIESSPQVTKETGKLGKAKTFVSKKGLVMPSFSSMFHKKKNQVEGSYLPGEKPTW